MKNKIKKALAKEGLIVLGLGIMLYLFLLFILKFPLSLPKYKLEFSDGRSYTIVIFPEVSQRFSGDNPLEEVFSPASRLISKRAEEFIKDNKIKPELKRLSLINPREVSISKFVYFLLKLNFIIKLTVVYAFVLAIRFILWALKALKEK